MRNDPNRFHFSNLADNLTTSQIFPLRRKKALELYGLTMRSFVTPGQPSTVKLVDCRVGKAPAKRRLLSGPMNRYPLTAIHKSAKIVESRAAKHIQISCLPQDSSFNR